MTVGTFACETIDPVARRVDPEAERLEARLVGALRALQAAERAVERKRGDLADEIADVFRTGKFRAATIARIVDYTPEHVRRILRAHGIEGDASRLSPTQRQRAAEES